MNKKTGIAIGMGILAVLMIAGMAIQYTPGQGNMFASSSTSPTAFKVNGQAVPVSELEGFRKSSPALSVDQGVLGDDVKTLLVSRLTQITLLQQAAKDIKISRDEINAEVKKTREQYQLTDNKAWSDALQNAGLTDSSFRKRIQEKLAQERFMADLTKKLPAPSDTAIKLYYDLNKQNYMGDPKLVGRQIVVADKALANKLHAQLKAGGDFAKLASANSLENKDRGGALGALENGKPKAVSLITLPSQVGEAVKKLSNGGLTEVIENGGRFYIVKVEQMLPAEPKPLDTVKSEISTALQEQQKAAAQEKLLYDLEKGAKVEYVDPAWKVENPVVASVAGQEIRYAEVVNQVLGNQQVASAMGQLPPEQIAGMINSSLKPDIVKQLINGYAAPSIVEKLKLPLLGSRPALLQGLMTYATRNVTVSDADMKAFYDKNKAQFQNPAKATISELSFRDAAKAAAFRNSWKGQGDLAWAAAQAGGTLSERGEVSSGGQLSPELEKAAFEGQLRSVGALGLSEVVKQGDRATIVLVSGRQAKTIQPFAQVSGAIKEQLTNTKKMEAAQAFLKKEVDALKPQNNLAAVLKAQEARVKAAEAAQKKPNSSTPNATPAGQDTPKSSSEPAQTEPAKTDDKNSTPAKSSS